MTNKNTLAQRTYYYRHRPRVMASKVLRAMRMRGSVPSHRTVIKYDIPLTSLLEAFGDWATTDVQDMNVVLQQRELMQDLRHRLERPDEPRSVARPPTRDLVQRLILDLLDEHPQIL